MKVINVLNLYLFFVFLFVFGCGFFLSLYVVCESLNPNFRYVFSTMLFVCFQSMQMFKGNSDGNSIHYNVFEVPIIAQWIRINPTRWHDRISMRVELYGCEYGMWLFS